MGAYSGFYRDTLRRSGYRKIVAALILPAILFVLTAGTAFICPQPVRNEEQLLVSGPDSMPIPFAQPDVTLATPNGGENWTSGTSHDISGIVQYGSLPFKLTVNYSISGESGPWFPIVKNMLSTTHSFTYSWLIPAIATSINCYVSVFVIDSISLYTSDKSDFGFTIWSNPVSVPVISIMSPSGGENWSATSVHDIHWTAYGGALPLKLSIEYKAGACGFQPVAGNLNNSGQYLWNTPNTYSTQCFIKIIASDSSIPSRMNFTISRNFTIWNGSIPPCPRIAYVNITPDSQALQVGTSIIFTAEAFDQAWKPITADFTWKVSTPLQGQIIPDRNSARFIAGTECAGDIFVEARYEGYIVSESAKIKVTQTTPKLDRVTVAPIYWIGKSGAKKEFTAQGWNETYQINLEYCIWDVKPPSLGTLQVTSDRTVLLSAESDGTGRLMVRGGYNGTELEGSAEIHIDSGKILEGISPVILWVLSAIIIIVLVISVGMYLYLKTRRKKDKDRILKEWSEVLTVMKKRRCPKCNTFIPVGMSICPTCITTPMRRETLIDEIFLLYNDGRLIKHHTRRLKPAVDEKIFSSMLVAVQDFVKDSYGYEEGALDELKFGDYRILIGRGRYIIIAAIVSGDDTEPIKVQLRKAINELERNYQDVLINWDGNMDAIAGVNKFIEYLIIGDYA